MDSFLVEIPCCWVGRGLPGLWLLLQRIRCRFKLSPASLQLQDATRCAPLLFLPRSDPTRIRPILARRAIGSGTSTELNAARSLQLKRNLPLSHAINYRKASVRLTCSRTKRRLQDAAAKYGIPGDPAFVNLSSPRNYAFLNSSTPS